ncbi:tRNA (N6-threonylcarbamoyladenosine(37)-N6)-methyltransferase TrmO [Hahella sp. HN01]|nr:tRNA (N6-threonylcarbamoyladenosine(37)-N6)-methyltransferase TrmO [Hahella sp. HN01]
MEDLIYRPIGHIRSCFPEKFGAPRQPGLIKHAITEIVLTQEFSSVEAVSGLTAFSHIWVLFHFHKTAAAGWKPKVRPPRLGGNKSVGVFASRSPFRPNPIGLSAVRLLSVQEHEGLQVLSVEGGDFVDGAPVLDIKPYIPYVDAIEAEGGYAVEKPEPCLEVRFTEEAEHSLRQFSPQYPNLRELIIETIGLDPRPSYKKSQTDSKVYGLALYNLNISWRVYDDYALVSAVTPLEVNE